MSKIICDVCGTSYPDTATQCPICGCVRPGEAKSVMGDTADHELNGGYTYVKGGRFSKSNVRKRNKPSGGYQPVPTPAPADDDREKSDNKGLVIAAIVLLLAIIAVVIYISVQFFLPGVGSSDPTTLPKLPEQTGTTESTSLEVPCENLKLDVTTITFDKQNVARMIYATSEPSNTTDEILFESSDESIVTVNENGKVTAVGPGQATITVTCGNIKTECIVECTFEVPTESTPPTDPSQGATEPEEEFRLNRSDITFSKKGDSWMIYSGNLGLTQITWTSDDETIATIKNGKVIAVGKGTTNVHAEYNGQKVSCIIRCVFADSADSNTGSSGNVTEDGGSAGVNGTYALKNTVGGPNDDVTLPVGKAFTMQLVDAGGNKVSGVTWTVSNDAVCTVSDGLVTAISAGTATVTASYQGTAYSFFVRVS